MELPVVETIIEDHLVKGAIDILDVRFGSLWTSVTREEFYKLEPDFGDRFGDYLSRRYAGLSKSGCLWQIICRCENWATILYINSLYRLGLAIPTKVPLPKLIM